MPRSWVSSGPDAIDAAGVCDVTTAALFTVMVRWVGGRGWLATALASAIGAGGSYLLFGHLLRVELPAGLWIP